MDKPDIQDKPTAVEDDNDPPYILKYRDNNELLIQCSEIEADIKKTEE